jgi:hypothetical protein
MNRVDLMDRTDAAQRAQDSPGVIDQETRQLTMRFAKSTLSTRSVENGSTAVRGALGFDSIRRSS